MCSRSDHEHLGAVGDDPAEVLVGVAFVITSLDPVPEWRRRALALIAATGRNLAAIDTTALVTADSLVRPACVARR